MVSDDHLRHSVYGLREDKKPRELKGMKFRPEEVKIPDQRPAGHRTETAGKFMSLLKHHAWRCKRDAIGRSAPARFHAATGR